MIWIPTLLLVISYGLPAMNPAIKGWQTNHIGDHSHTKTYGMTELKQGETLCYNEITIVHHSGGHKITMGEDGKRSGDLSFANLIFKKRGMDPVKHRFFAKTSNDEAFEFGGYAMSVVEMSWNGTRLMLHIERINRSSNPE